MDLWAFADVERVPNARASRSGRSSVAGGFTRHDGGLSDPVVWELALGLVIVLLALAWAFNGLLSLLHREYLACLVLLHRLHPFAGAVVSAIGTHGEPPSSTYYERDDEVRRQVDELVAILAS